MAANLGNGITEERLIEAIVLVSEIIIKHGAQYAPILDRLERELEKLRNQADDPITRALAHLAAADLAKAK